MTQSLPHQAAEVIKQRLPDFTPKLGIILGSGLGKFADSIADATVIDYEDLPGFPKISVKGHTGRMILGYLEKTPVVCLQGRAHPYEGQQEANNAIKNYVRTLKLLGCETYLATNASGSFREHIGPGSLVAVTDHINFQPGNVLAGPNDDEFGPRFPAMDNAYDADVRKQLHACADKLNIELNEGTYISVLGPTYETPAEINMFRTMGADVIGMSTVPEVIVARHCGLKVAVIAIVTNLVTGLSETSHDHNEVVKAANEAAERLTKLIIEFAKTV